MAVESRVFLSTLPADRGERRLALAAALASLLIMLAAAPYAKVPLAPVAAFLPLYQSALVVCDLVTAILLFGQFAILRSRALLVLAGGFLFSAAMAVCHALSFPGLFSPSGLLGSGPQTTAWLYFFWHLGFPAAVIAYALLRDEPPREASGTAIAGAAATALAAAGALTLAATVGHDALPVIMRGNEDAPAKYALAWITWLATLAALPVLWRRRPHSVLDVWLMVVICAWLCDVALAAVFNAGRYSVGWYAGRVYGLLAASFVLAVLLLENSSLYARLDELNKSLERRIGLRTAELERSRHQLHEIATVGATAREQEKSRIARELHDELGQALTALKMDLGWLDKRAPAADEMFAAKIAGMRELLDGMVASTRRIAADLRPLLLDDLGLVPAAQWLVEGFGQRHGIECELEIDPPELDLADPQATAVFRIMQESLTNVARHAGASRVALKLSRANGELRLQVRDDGRGFDPGAPRRPNAFGLLGLRERAHVVAGRITIHSAPGRGTTIDVSIPLPPASARP
ncbi:MAG TPA: sensor histidine kinase [Burkholderiales bacterium]|nr:sensor histidine kinase [Burkholderiales bacterium]